MIKVTIITVTYNSSDKIQKFLDSLIVNKERISEVFIIENDSPDQIETRKVCNKYVKRLNLTFVHHENEGFGKSCNYGLSLAKSPYVLFINPDTEIQPNALEILVKHCEKEDADIVGGKAITYEGKTHGSVVRIPTLSTGFFEFSNLGKILNVNYAHKKFYYEDRKILDSRNDQIVDAVSGGYMLVKKISMDQLGGFDENIFMYLEDVDLGKRAKELGMKVVFCPHSLIWHVGGSSSKNKYRILYKAWFDSRKYYYRKHFGIFKNILIQPLFIFEEYLLKKIKSL